MTILCGICAFLFTCGSGIRDRYCSKICDRLCRKAPSGHFIERDRDAVERGWEHKEGTKRKEERGKNGNA